MYEYNAAITRIVDGDTVDVDVDLGFSVHHHSRVRLYGINAAESRTRDLEEKKRGLAAKARLLELCPVNSKVILRTLRDAHGKYGRILGELFIRDHGHLEPIKALVNVNKKLVEEGHAVEYFGGKR